MKHNIPFSIFEISQDLINFLRGDDIYKYNGMEHDSQIYSHYGENKLITDKYIGIIIEFQNNRYFAPLTHDGNKKWYSREDSCDFEPIFDDSNHYLGCVLLCKALPLTNNLVRRLKIKEIERESGYRYARLCSNELNYLNKNVHTKIQDKMQKCIYNFDSPHKHYRVNYFLASKNIAEYNAMLLTEAKKKIEWLESGIKSTKTKSQNVDVTESNEEKPKIKQQGIK